MGVFGKVRFEADKISGTPKIIPELRRLERLVEKLWSPEWPDAFPAPEPGDGAALYAADWVHRPSRRGGGSGAMRGRTLFAVAASWIASTAIPVGAAGAARALTAWIIPYFEVRLEPYSRAR